MTLRAVAVCSTDTKKLVVWHLGKEPGELSLGQQG